MSDKKSKRLSSDTDAGRLGDEDGLQRSGSGGYGGDWVCSDTE